LPVCASALAAADFCAGVAAPDRNVLLAADAAQHLAPAHLKWAGAAADFNFHRSDLTPAIRDFNVRLAESGTLVTEVRPLLAESR
jgi:hypothetical protein